MSWLTWNNPTCEEEEEAREMKKKAAAAALAEGVVKAGCIESCQWIWVFESVGMSIISVECHLAEYQKSWETQGPCGS